MITGTLAASATACSTARDAPDPVLWRQLDAAENEMYEELAGPSVTARTPQGLFEELTEAIGYWDRSTPPRYSDEHGTAVFYDYREAAGGGEASFKMFVASGRVDQPTRTRMFAAEAQRVYTCYRIDVSFERGFLSGFYRGSDSDEQPLQCPHDLVDALGDGSQYREPWLFDG